VAKSSSSGTRRWISRIIRSPQIAGLAVLVVLLSLLELAVRKSIIPATIVARPSDAIAGLFTLQEKADVIGGFQITFTVITVAMLLELVVAIPFGYFLFRRRDFGTAYAGWLAALFAAPVFLLYPLFLVIFGRGYLTLVLMGFLPGVIPMIIQAEQGFLGISPTLINVGRSYRLTAGQIFWKIMVPAAAPSIFTGLRLGLMYTLINIVAIEYLVDIGGLGRIVADRYFRFDIPGTYSAIVAVAAISILFNWLIGRAERWIKPI
jgi:NitT/TauT family transport system permease protein